MSADDVKKEISELRKMISDYIVFLKQFTMKTLDTLRAIDRRLATLEARIIRGEIKVESKIIEPKPKTIIEKKPEVAPKIETPAIKEEEIVEPSIPHASITTTAKIQQQITPPKIKAPKIIAPKPSMIKPKRKKEEEEEIPPDSMAAISESLMEILDV